MQVDIWINKVRFGYVEVAALASSVLLTQLSMAKWFSARVILVTLYLLAVIKLTAYQIPQWSYVVPFLLSLCLAVKKKNVLLILTTLTLLIMSVGFVWSSSPKEI